MTAAELQALLPYFVLSGGIVALLMLVAWLRKEAVAFGGALVVLLASLATMPYAAGAGPQLIDGMVRVDGFALFFFALFALAALATAVLAFRYLRPRADHRQEFYILLAIAVLGAAATASAANFAGFLLGLEVLSISLYALIAYPQDAKPPLEAATKYLVLSGAASSTMLFGMALVYMATGTLAFAFDAGELARSDRNILVLGQAMLLAGVFFKLSLIPFHMWTPDVYQGAPAPVTGFVATVSKGAVFAVLLRYAVDSGLLTSAMLQTAVVVVAVLSMIGGNVLALLQTNIKRLLAYSSIAHLGYLLIPLLVAAGPGGDRGLGVESSLMYLAGYFLMTLAAFGVATVLSADDVEAEDLEAYDGLFWRRPLLAAVLAAAALSLAGIPLTVGFIAKFYVVAAGVSAVEVATWTLIWALLIGSAIGVYYYLRIVFAMAKRPEPAVMGARVSGFAWEGIAVALVLGVAVLVLGVQPSFLIEALPTLPAGG